MSTLTDILQRNDVKKRSRIQEKMMDFTLDIGWAS